MTTGSQRKHKFPRMSQRHNVGNAPISAPGERDALSRLSSSQDDRDLRRFKETAWSPYSLWFIYVTVTASVKGWRDGGMEGTLCISSIPNSSSSQCYGKREGGEEGERMERRVRKAGRREVWENRRWCYTTSTTEIREANVGALLELTCRRHQTWSYKHERNYESWETANRRTDS